MSNKKKHKRSEDPAWKRQRRLRIRGVRHDPPDLQRLGRALIDLAVAAAEAEAQEQHGEGDGSERSAS